MDPTIGAIWIVSALISAAIGKYKRQLWKSVAIGVLFGPLGAIAALMSDAKCPFCAYGIPTFAKVCPHCTRDLPPA
jgi:hypothetical protein